MTLRNLLFLPVFVLVCSPALAPAQASKASAPVVVRVHALDDMKENLAYFGSLVGRDELKLLTRFIVVPAVDSKKPFGLYAVLGAKPADCALVGMVPITSEESLVKTLSLFKIKLTKLDNGLHGVNDAPHPMHIRVATGYAYLTQGPKEVLLGDKLLEPKRLVAADKNEVFSVSVRPDLIPESLTKEVTDWIANTSRLLQQLTLPFEAESHRALRKEVIKLLADEHLMLIRDAGELTHSVKVDRQANRLGVETTFAARPNSKLSGRFADLGKGPSLFSAIAGADAAMSGLGHFQLPAEHRKLVNTVLDELMQHAEKHAKAWKRESSLAIAKALLPTLKSGDIDHGFSLRGPGEGGVYTLVAGARVKDGGAIEEALRNRLKELPEAAQKYVKLDAEKAGDLNIHRVDIPEKRLKHHARIFGKNPIYVAFRSDAVMVGVGDNGLAALKQALAATPKAAPVQQFNLSVARLAAGRAKEHQALAKAVQEAFGMDKDGGKVSFVVEGGETVRVRFDMDTSIIKFLAKAILSR